MRPYLAPEPQRPVERGPVPTFSVVIAAFQVADLAPSAVASALVQTLPPHEVIVCDDGSTDNLELGLAPFRDRIVYVRQENRGEASAKNTAARVASGDFVAILDADDVYLPERLEALGELASARPDLDIVTTDAYLEVDGEVVRRCYETAWPFEVADQRRAILERNFIFGLAAVRRESLLAAGGFDESLRWAMDWDCWLRLILDGAQAGTVLEPLARYRLRERSLSADRTHLVEGRVSTLRKALRNASVRPEERPTLARSLARQESELAFLEACDALLAGDPAARRYCLALATGRNFSAGIRLRGAAAGLAPGLARRWLRRRRGAAWIGAAGVRVMRR
jgi:glycosyltransferase involved in cell wall biosynthesis